MKAEENFCHSSNHFHWWSSTFSIDHFHNECCEWHRANHWDSFEWTYFSAQWNHYALRLPLKNRNEWFFFDFDRIWPSTVPHWYCRTRVRLLPFSRMKLLPTTANGTLSLSIFVNLFSSSSSSQSGNSSSLIFSLATSCIIAFLNKRNSSDVNVSALAMTGMMFTRSWSRFMNSMSNACRLFERKAGTVRTERSRPLTCDSLGWESRGNSEHGYRWCVPFEWHETRHWDTLRTWHRCHPWSVASWKGKRWSRCSSRRSKTNQLELSTASPKPGVSTMVSLSCTPFSFRMIDDESMEMLFFFRWSVEGKSCPESSVWNNVLMKVDLPRPDWPETRRAAMRNEGREERRTDDHQIEFESFLHGSSMNLIGQRNESNVRTDFSNSRCGWLIFRRWVRFWFSSRANQFGNGRVVRCRSSVAVRRRRDRCGGRIRVDRRVERGAILAVARLTMRGVTVENRRLVKIFQGDAMDGTFAVRRRNGWWRWWRRRRRSDRWRSIGIRR